MAHLGFGNTCGSTSSAVDALFTRQPDGSMARDVGGGLKVVRVTEDSPLLPAAIDVIARSECGSTTTAPDPLLDWVYSPRTEGVCTPLSQPPSKDRVAWFRWMATYSAYFGMGRNGFYALVDQASGQVVAATITGPPGTIAFGRMSTGEMEYNLRKAGMAMAIEVLVYCRRNNVLGEWQGRAQEMAQLMKKHLYVLFFDTAPEWQGRGCGSVLLRFLGDVADADGVDSFLETAGTRNTTFYAKKGGYEEVHRSPVATFDFEGGGVAMRRLPRSNNINQRHDQRPMLAVPTASTSSRGGDNSGVCGGDNSGVCGTMFSPTSRAESNIVARVEKVERVDAPLTRGPAVDRLAGRPTVDGAVSSHPELALLHTLPKPDPDHHETQCAPEFVTAGHTFTAKRHMGPLASWCRICDHHQHEHAQAGGYLQRKCWAFRPVPA